MQVVNRAKRGLAAAGLLLATAALAAGCTSTIAGRPTCPGCGSQAEPSFPTTRPTPSTPPQPSTPAVPVPQPSANAPAGAVPLSPDQRGYVYIETKSGLTRCQISADSVGCEAQFANSPMADGGRANGVSVTAGGAVRWVLGNLGDIPVVTLDYRTYHAQGWTISATSDGTRFTNDGTGHGMFVSIDEVDAF